MGRGNHTLQERVKKEMEETIVRICNEKEKELQAAISHACSEVVRAYENGEEYRKDLTNIIDELILEHMMESHT